MKNLVATLSLLALTGCSAFIPSEKNTQAAVKTAGTLSATHEEQLTKRVTTPPVAMRLGGIGNKVDIQMPQPVRNYRDEVSVSSKETLDSEGSDSARASDKTSIPMFVKIIGLAIGLAMLGAVIVYGIKAIRNGAAGAAAATAFDVADKAAASSISSVEAMLHASNDPGQKQVLLATLNDLNKSRGKLAAAAPAQTA